MNNMKTTIQVTEQNFDLEVLKPTQPVIVDFYADWCGPCKMIAPALEEIASEQSGKVKIAKINADEEPALEQRYNVQSVPKLLYYNEEKVVGKTIGATSKKNIQRKLNSTAAVA